MLTLAEVYTQQNLIQVLSLLRTLRSLWNFTPKLIRKQWTTQKNFIKIRGHTHAHEAKANMRCKCVRAHAHVFARMRIFALCPQLCAQIFTKKFLLVYCYLMSLGVKFQKDCSIHYEEIWKVKKGIIFILNFQCNLHIFIIKHQKCLKRWEIN